MNRLSSRWLPLVLVSLGGLALAGCGTLRPLSSKPPLPKITLSSPYKASGWEGLLPPTPWSVILPAGEYRPMYEDDQYYFYQAPAKVVVNQPGSHMFDGGIYVARGTTIPRGWYYVGEDGAQNFGRFETPLPLR